MDNGHHDVYTDPLFVGLTRPAMLWGIPYTAFVIEFMAITLIFLAVGNPLYLLLVVPIHGVLYLISANNPGVFNSIYLWVQTTGRCRNIRFWGAASFSPLPTKKWSE
ncbi:Conjugal transfer protein [Candidatus Methylobacter favarea]|uniref:Conjugal transfer protein n=1 Tax=Candidatus Methylobacter favarea TaxID=2707345 RepID=A0A8S0Y692_9GAMM|nr:type IV secretion system protein VirB3 [Candidatus Methylobacter favarea]CAA9890773.1 Conjugal transfer protein [Candidatus Methylobacter favarea]